jgi:hypothetical protein
MEQTYLRGERCNFIFRSNLKDEARPLTKEKVRVFAGAPLGASVLIRKYFLPVIAFIQKFPILFECAVGVNAHGPDWTAFMERVRCFKNDKAIAGDYASYDLRMSVKFTERAYGIIYAIILFANRYNGGAYSEDDLCVIRGLLTDLCQPIYEHNGDLIGVVGSNPSGHNMTVIVNSLVNSLYFRYAYYMLGAVQQNGLPVGLPPFFRVVALITYGDDNLCGVHDDFLWFSHTSVMLVLQTIGVVYTMADKESESVPHISFEETSFLKRKAVYMPELGQYFAPLELDSIYKSLHCSKKSVETPEALSGGAISNALGELFYHGKEIYDVRVAQLEMIARTTGITPFVIGGFPTYEEQLSCYCAKYKIESV